MSTSSNARDATEVSKSRYLNDRKGGNLERKGIPKPVPSLTQNVASYVSDHHGSKPITSILVANNGLGAVKFIRSVRMWSVRTFGSDKAISMVAMATPEDIRINAEHLQLADQFVEVPGGTNNNNYANVRLILQTAERARVDAVWPGWGHASEDPQLPRALSETEIVFLGPPAPAMAALGDKVGSTILAQAAGVPTYPWSGTGVQISFQECNGVIPKAIYEQACLQSETAADCCERIGYPIMLKASWGGGGKGIRTVRSKDEVEFILKQVQGEVPGSPIFAMKLASRCRHLEVQLLCDQYGNVCSLYSRDCSLQRRHQKIVEEGPVLDVDQHLLNEMEKSARALAKSVGYVGAATVEYLYSIREAKYYFLELNPRLQVEHPVTEGITSVNLPACQVMIGMGIPLHMIPDIRAVYGEDPRGSSIIDFENQEKVPPDGHVLAVRITSENANDGFKPTSGKIDDLHFRPTSEVWGYFSVKSGGGIHEFSDSQFGHLFAKGTTRQSAIRAMIVALKEVKIRGEIRTTVDYIINMIQEPDFENQNIHTAWLDNRIAQQICSERPPWPIALVSGSVVKAMENFTSRSADYLDLLHKGQIPPSSFSLTALEEDLVLDGMKYAVRVRRQGLSYFRVELNGSGVDCVARSQADGGILLQLDGEKHVIYSEKEPMGIRLSIDSWTCLLANESDPTKVLAPSAGKIRRYLVEDGSRVIPDQGYAELEVMKMLMPLLAPAAGTVHFRLPEGAILSCGDLIAQLELEDPDSVHRAVPSKERFPDTMGPPQVATERVTDRFTLALEAAEDILAGFERDVDQTVSELLICLDDKDLAFLRWSEQYSVAQNRLPNEIKDRLEAIMKTYDNSSFDIFPEVSCFEFPSQELLQCMEAYIEDSSEEDQTALETTILPLITLVQEHHGGKEGFAKKITKHLLERYLEVEEKFQPKGDLSTEQDVIYTLRHEYNEDLQDVLKLVLSHQGLKRKAEFVKQLLLHLVLPSPSDYRPILRRLTSLVSPTTRQILVKAQYLLEHSLLADLRAVVARSLSGLDMFSGSLTRAGSALQSGVARKATQGEGLYKGLGNMFASQMARSQAEAQKMNMLVEAPAAVEDALALLIEQVPESSSEGHRTSSSSAANALVPMPSLGADYRILMTYIKRIYHRQLIQEPKITLHQYFTLAQWTYQGHLSVDEVEDQGMMIVLSSLSHLKHGVECLRQEMENKTRGGQDWKDGTLHVALTGDSEEVFELFPEAEEVFKKGEFDDVTFQDHFDRDDRVTESLVAMDPRHVSLTIQSCIQALHPTLHSLHISTISFMIKTPKIPLRKGYSWNEERQRYVPQITLRYLEPPIARALELSKLEVLSPIYAPSRNRQWHSFTFDEKINQRQSLKRLFLRGLIHQIGGTPAYLAASYSKNEAEIAVAVINEIEETLADCLQELLRVRNSVDTSGVGMVDWAHIFLSILPPVNLQPAIPDRKATKLVSAFRSACAALVSRQIASLRHAAVAQVELRVPVEGTGSAWRVVISVPTGHETGEEHIDLYKESIYDTPSLLYSAVSPSSSEGLNNKGILEPYSALSLLQQKQLTAKRHSTTYCYDFPKVFGNALQEIWSDRASNGEPGSIPPHGQLVETQELGLCSSGVHTSPYDWPLEFVETHIGQNKIGMVAWLLTVRTPECPQGRQVVAIANDITFQSGAFGPKEDALFKSAVEYALHEKLPVLYLAANSGARVGLAMEVRGKLKAVWNREEDPSKGVRHLYLEDTDYKALLSQGASLPPVLAQREESDGNIRWILTDVIGCEDGLGVECLSGSGAIAGAFSRAYKEGFTLTLVSGRTVGIGAYLARLGHRCIQANQPIILTGYQALNKLLGREVYTSQLQLGGPRIMGVNGVSHHIVQDDLTGIKLMLRWLSYTPSVLGGSPSLIATSDPVDRGPVYCPEAGEKLDARKAILELFDKNSWLEAQEGWAKTVVTGRARLGGIPIGVIAVETQTVFKTIPADPGMLESSEQKIPQAGQVWFPDSAAKTAQAMEEFDLEGLPLIILANWRGFSGGQRDLFEGVLQAGSLIVDNLRTYKKPVFVYLPPGCELRGGAWVVIDSKINSEVVEMYADPSARGGVLEPEGVVEIKFKRTDLVKMMRRLDPELQRLISLDASPQETSKREDLLMPVYHQIALQFAEMHDTPQRMLAKEIIRRIVPWSEARGFFIRRLKRRLMEESLISHIATADASISRLEAGRLLHEWFNDSMLDEGLWMDDNAVQQWAESSNGSSRIALELKGIKSAAAERQVRQILSSTEGKEGLLKAMENAIHLDSHFKKQLSALLKE